MAKKRTKVFSTEDEPQVYKLTLQLGDTTYESTGATILEALRGLKRPDKIMAKSVLTLERGGFKSQQMFLPTRLKRLFYSSPIMQEIQAKQLEKVGLKPV